ncbi:23S rRNA (cytidine(2498)-2'-O)-methyltransferase RlmM [Entomomonas asaccharolytica]|uniref:Ribosomal RNA large subunit methyltransferase M n=1 Tax=Entomomonas asaccharolytica TaxID=2785331 RepID=A0A974RYB0_9GAMM|nr:23S rRNA (cytidine(2498)-2'-O)-methyltransferase RlmM [Entomomonas asaccharolytica]QQP87108.1 23S rRNA (cytidine(2498)-2'-O)-methyltransferase RlmM [Entomomonas asaccharolytica]
MNTLLLHCRAGFESEVCAEITEKANSLGVIGYARGKTNNAYAEFICQDSIQASLLINKLLFSDLIFPRQWAIGQYIELPESDRISTILNTLQQYPLFGSVWLEMLDTNEGKALSTFCRKFEKPLISHLKKSGKLIDDPNKPRLLLTFFTGQKVFVGYALPHNSAKWPMGIPRLKFPREAPSRSTLKLEEAWHQFIPSKQWDTRLAPAMKAVDLGAAPGGWTWQLVKRHMYVTAIDNGPMQPQLMETGQVEHIRADGFTYQPRKPVNWMVCDIVEKPARTAAMVQTWLAEGWCKEAIVNLKLPMKQRYQEVVRLVEKMQDHFINQQIKVKITCKQLYHDREEITCHLQRLN